MQSIFTITSWVKVHPCTQSCFPCRWRNLLVLFILIPVIYQTLLYIYPDPASRWEDWETGLQSRKRVPTSGCKCALLSPQWTTNTSSPFPLNSTCSDKRTFYQRDQNVISLSLHLGPRRRKKNLLPTYVKGLELNARVTRKLYPNFTIRVYTDVQLTPENPFCSTLCDNSHVFWCDVWEIPRSRFDNNDKFLNPTRMMVWRALPLGDPTVDIFLSRDLDSLVTPREVAAVSDWLQYRPPRGVHVMRDHKQHQSKIMGGMWGARNRWLSNAKQMQTDIILESEVLDNPNTTENDQDVFNKVISGSDLLAHDSYHCGNTTKLYQSAWRPFPTQRQGIGPDYNDFVGNSGLGKPIHTFAPCPVACRPSYGQDWEYC